MVKRAHIFSMYAIAFANDKILDPVTDIETSKKLQKIAYIVQEVLNVPLDIDFSMYLYGPYSPELSELYYEQNFLLNVIATQPPPSILKIQDKLRKLGKKDARWLETVATFYSMRKRAKDDKDAMISVTKIKPVSLEDVKKYVEEAKEILEK